MAEAIWRAVIVGGMLITGSLNTLSKNVQNQCTALGLESQPHLFHKPWFQTLLMFFGEATVLLLWLYQRHMANKEAPALEKSPEEERLVNNQNNASSSGKQTWVDKVPTWALLAFPASLDLLGTTMAGIGLLYTFASVWQMMRGSIVIFTGLFSILFLGRTLYTYNWIGIGITVVGLTLVGTASLLTEKGTTTVGNEWMGIFLIVIGQVLNALQMVVEEVFVKKRGLKPSQIVGFEGMWGCGLMIFFVLPMLYIIPGSDDGSYENSLDAAAMIGQNGLLLGMVIAYMCSIALYNFFGLSVAESLTSVHRTIVDGLRAAVVWGVDLAIYYGAGSHIYGEHLNKWSALELAGFILLVAGALVYNRVVRLPGLNYPSMEQIENEYKVVSTSDDVDDAHHSME